MHLAPITMILNIRTRYPRYPLQQIWPDRTTRWKFKYFINYTLESEGLNDAKIYKSSNRTFFKELIYSVNPFREPLKPSTRKASGLDVKDICTLYCIDNCSRSTPSLRERKCKIAKNSFLVPLPIIKNSWLGVTVNAATYFIEVDTACKGKD